MNSDRSDEFQDGLGLSIVVLVVINFVFSSVGNEMTIMEGGVSLAFFPNHVSDFVGTPVSLQLN
jgi:hypothetical protein